MAVCEICKGLDRYGEPSVNREISSRSMFPTQCSVCRASITGWARRPPAQLMNYRTQLVVRTTRMELVKSVVPKKAVRKKKAA